MLCNYIEHSLTFWVDLHIVKSMYWLNTSKGVARVLKIILLKRIGAWVLSLFINIAQVSLYLISIIQVHRGSFPWWLWSSSTVLFSVYLFVLVWSINSWEFYSLEWGKQFPLQYCCLDTSCFPNASAPYYLLANLQSTRLNLIIYNLINTYFDKNFLLSLDILKTFSNLSLILFLNYSKVIDIVTTLSSQIRFRSFFKRNNNFFWH